MRFHPFVFLPERMRTACDRSGANGKERDEETSYSYFGDDYSWVPTGRTSVGVKPLLCTYQIPTNSLPTPTMVGVGRSFFKLKSADLTFMDRTWDWHLSQNNN